MTSLSDIISVFTTFSTNKSRQNSLLRTKSVKVPVITPITVPVKVPVITPITVPVTVPVNIEVPIKIQCDPNTKGGNGCYIVYSDIYETLCNLFLQEDFVFLEPINVQYSEHHKPIDNTKKESIVNAFKNKEIGFKIFSSMKIAVFRKEIDSINTLITLKLVEKYTTICSIDNIMYFKISDPRIKFIWENDTSEIYIIMYKNCTNDLQKFIDNKSENTYTIIQKLMDDITPLMEQLHLKKYIHFDLKPANIVYCDNLCKDLNACYRIIDFSLLKLTEDDNKEIHFKYIINNYNIITYFTATTKNYVLPFLYTDIKTYIKKYNETNGDRSLIIETTQTDVTIDKLKIISLNNILELLISNNKKLPMAYLYRKSDEYAIAQILFELCGNKITEENREYINKLLSYKRYFVTPKEGGKIYKNIN